jgi:hypothetical protein
LIRNQTSRKESYIVTPTACEKLPVMINTVRTRTKLVGAATVAVVLTVGAVVIVSQTSQAEVRLPPKGASSEQVLRVYLRAAQAHDCAVTVALSVGSDERDGAFCGGGSFLGLDDHPNLLSYKNIGAVSRVSASDTGEGFAEECIQVDIKETDMNGAEPGELPGWQFCFRRTSSGWRITDEGYG